MRSKKVTFTNSNDYELAARLDFPIDKHPLAYAVFAHVFTGSKSLSATRHISRALTLEGIAVLRFDFTGLGESEGDFADTTFTSNVEDLVAAADFLRNEYEAPSLLVGHSLGGAAAIFAAHRIPEIKALATIGTPSEPSHVQHLLQEGIDKIKQEGVATIDIGGRVFTIKKAFLDDLNSKNMFELLKQLKKPILVLHSPQDKIVSIDNAADIYHAAFHPKSFITLNGADHMLTGKKDALYTGSMIASWVTRYIDIPEKQALRTRAQVVARLDEDSIFTTEIMAGIHQFVADEPDQIGGNDFGPDPYELLSSSLAACTAMTLRMYAQRKKWDLQEVTVHIDHAKQHVEDCQTCENANSKIDRFVKQITLEGDLTDEQRQRLKEIADRCPVHRTLHSEVRIDSELI